MKKKFRFSSILLLTGAVLASVSCTGSSAGESGSLAPGAKTSVSLWGWGDEKEVRVFQDLLREYNANNTDNVYVNFVKKPSNSYYSVLETALTGRQAPDLFYLGDSMIKRFSEAGYVQELDEFIAKSEVIDMDDIWGTLMRRYQFSPLTYQYGPEESIWGLPKDIGPTVIFYNADAFAAKGITVISAKDEDGDGFVSVGEKNYPARGYNDELKVFNNKIAMTFEECDVLAALLSSGSTNANTHQTKWGFYSSWWFYAGWSVGGDVIQFKKTDDPQYKGGYWEFTLDDKHPNYRVQKSVTIEDKKYEIGDFVDYYSLPYLKENGIIKDAYLADGSLVELPSMRETFDYWLGYFKNGLSPKPADISTQIALFTSQDVAMFVDGRYDVPQLREDATFAWDVAPLPKHKDGKAAGHSGSMCLSMAKRSTVKDAAFKIIEYLSGPSGQDALAETGFNVPNQISLATDPSANFLNTNAKPLNNEVFLEAAAVQKGGDWTYLNDDRWIELWAPTLNGDVMNGVKTVDQLFATYKDQINEYLKQYTKVK